MGHICSLHWIRAQEKYLASAHPPHLSWGVLFYFILWGICFILKSNLGYSVSKWPKHLATSPISKDKNHNYSFNISLEILLTYINPLNSSWRKPLTWLAFLSCSYPLLIPVAPSPARGCPLCWFIAPLLGITSAAMRVIKRWSGRGAVGLC